MTAVQKLTKRLQGLPQAKREAIAVALLKEWDQQDWDLQIETDIEGGKLDFLMTEVEADVEAGRIEPL